MTNRKQMLAAALALGLVTLAVVVFFSTRDRPSANSIRDEEPYKRTEDKPPSAVPDETSDPDLTNQ